MLRALIRVCGPPGCIFSDDGREFSNRAILKVADGQGLLNEERFDSPDDARRKLAL